MEAKQLKTIKAVSIKSNQAAIICSKHKPWDPVKKKTKKNNKTREKLFEIFDKCFAHKDSPLRPKMLKEYILSYFH